MVVWTSGYPSHAPHANPSFNLEQDLLALKQLPSAEHWLGTDALGRDVFSRMVHGVSLTIAGVIEAVAMASLLGLSLGVSAGYFGGLWDRCVQQYVSLVQSLPTMLIMLAVLAVFGQAMLPAMVMGAAAFSDGRKLITTVREVVAASGAVTEAAAKYPEGWKTVKPYLRIVAQPQ